MIRHLLFAPIVLCCCSVLAQEADPPKSFSARDSLAVGEEPDADARACLAALAWTPQAFTVRLEDSLTKRGDALVRFPSPFDSGDAINDRVAMEWYQPRDDQGQPLRARAVVVVHESGSGMNVGRLFARGLQRQGLHAFLIHLPFYGERRVGKRRPSAANLVTVIRQAVADVRRARDAVAVLPLVDASHVALQGTSLGGFVATTTASLDRGYQSVFIMLAGGRLYDLFQKGEKDTAKVRREFEQAGVTGQELKALLWTVEPTRVAHRLDRKRTWLYSATFDRVVPFANALALAESAGLDGTHHIKMSANHYSGIVYLPFILKHMSQRVVSTSQSPQGPQGPGTQPGTDRPGAP